MEFFTDLSKLNENELENRIHDLTKKYFMTYNADLKSQVSRLLDYHKQELSYRRHKTYEQQFEKNKDKGLDNLIKIN